MVNKVRSCVFISGNGSNLRSFLNEINEPNVGCVYDTGNRVVDNPEIDEEIKLLGDLIAHVHIKDKNSNGDNVILGTGLVNFLKVFEALENIGYDGPLVFETTRGFSPIRTASYHIEICNFFSYEAKNGTRY